MLRSHRLSHVLLSLILPLAACEATRVASVTEQPLHNVVVTPGGTFEITLKPLALPPGMTEGFPLSINEKGEMAGRGWFANSLDSRAVMWLADGTPVDLSLTCETPLSSAEGINARGQVVGWCMNASGFADAVVWTDGVPRVLAALPGYEDVIARSIDARGDVLGVHYSFSSGAAVPVVWPRGRDPVVVGDCPTPQCLASAGKFDQYVVGEYIVNFLTERGLLWQRSVVTTLHAPSGLGHTKTSANDVNGDLGLVVGAVLSDFNRTLVRAMTWDFAGTPSALPLHGSQTPLDAAAISDEGVIVGVMQDASLRFSGYVWSPAIGYIPLPEPSGSFGAYALDIASSGWIAGSYSPTFSSDAPIRWQMRRVN